jgi:hypothetical protein
MDRCANTESLNRHLYEQESIEKAEEHFENNIQEELEDINAQLQIIRASAKDYEGYDLSEFANELIGDTI